MLPLLMGLGAYLITDSALRDDGPGFAMCVTRKYDRLFDILSEKKQESNGTKEDNV